jgi:excisionase family DNA binding protein
MEQTTTTGADDLLTVSEAADILQCSIGTVRRWAAGDDPALPSIRTPGNQRRFRRADV